MRRISEILKENEKSSIYGFIELNKHWRKALTANISSVTTPVKITNGALFVLVHDNIWLTELNYMKDDLVERLQCYGMAVSSLTFKYSPAYIKYETARVPRYKVTEQEKFYIEKIAGNIDNKILKKAFKKAMDAYFQRYTFEEFINGH